MLPADDLAIPRPVTEVSAVVDAVLAEHNDHTIGGWRAIRGAELAHIGRVVAHLASCRLAGRWFAAALALFVGLGVVVGAATVLAGRIGLGVGITLIALAVIATASCCLALAKPIDR